MWNWLGAQIWKVPSCGRKEGQVNALIVTHEKQVHFIGFVLDCGDRREQYTTFDISCVSPLFFRASNLVAIDRHGNWYYHREQIKTTLMEWDACTFSVVANKTWNLQRKHPYPCQPPKRHSAHRAAHVTFSRMVRISHRQTTEVESSHRHVRCKVACVLHDLPCGDDKISVVTEVKFRLEWIPSPGVIPVQVLEYKTRSLRHKASQRYSAFIRPHVRVRCQLSN